MTEQEMRESVVPWPKSVDELQAYIDSLVSQPHDYGTCVYAMSMAATAAFYYVSSKLGVTGFQAGCASLDVIRRIKSIEGPFIVLDASQALFPQYNLPQKLAEFLEECKPWLSEQASKKLAEQPEHAHPNVIAHWQSLVATTEPV